ncbi:unnamed protein product, partial [Ectocarpus sp. 8 AP-2014]
MLFVAVVKAGAAANNDSGAGSGGNCGDSTVNCRTPDQVAPGAAGRTRDSTTVTAAERKSAIDLLQAATKEAKKNKMKDAAKPNIKSGRCLAKATDGRDAVKAKTLQCWAAKGKQNVRQLLKLLLGSAGSVVNARPDHARLLKFHTQGISSEEARKESVRGTTAAAAAAAALSEETPSSSSKEDMFTIVEAADEKWSSSDDDEEEAPLTRKRSDSSTERIQGDRENGVPTSAPLACTDVMDGPTTAQPAPRRASLVLDEVTNTPGPADMAAEG